MEKISSFRGEYRFLSNFYQHPIEYEGLTYPNAEAAFQAQKCTDPADRVKYTLIKNPVRAKQMGRKERLRPDWNSVSYGIMRDILYAKFTAPELSEMLRSTDDAYIEEGNRWHDNIWGSCHCDRCIGIAGENRMGRILMEIRDGQR